MFVGLKNVGGRKNVNNESAGGFFRATVRKILGVIWGVLLNCTGKRKIRKGRWLSRASKSEGRGQRD